MSMLAKIFGVKTRPRRLFPARYEVQRFKSAAISANWARAVIGRRAKKTAEKVQKVRTAHFAHAKLNITRVCLPPEKLQKMRPDPPIVPLLLQPLRMNKTARSFVQLFVLAARKVAFKAKLVGHRVETVAELQQQIHDDLRRQHPEWIEPSGDSPVCDFYEARLNQLLELCGRSSPAKAA
jgi:hypothetical protein